MLSLKHLFTATALLVLMNACGSSPQTSTGDASIAPQVESNETNVDPLNAEARSAVVMADAPNGGSAVACSYSINGKNSEGKTQEECDRLKKEFDKLAAASSIPAPLPVPSAAAPGSSQVACSFNINGKLYEGKTQAECDKLKKDLGITTTLPSIPAPAPAPAPSAPVVSNVACAYNINGKLYEGKTQAECDKLKKDLGFQI